jgi:archaellum biogenesis ATPase FlaH
MYQGGMYLCYGDAASGRGLLAMLFLQAGVEQGETCLFISPGRPQDWFIQGDSVSFDLQGAHEKGLVRLLWIPDVSGLHHLDDHDAARALSDLVTIVVQERPTRVVINDFMPFMQFRSFDGFRQAFLGALEALSATETTILLLLPDPINPVSQKIIDFVRNYVSGSIHLELDTSSSAGATRRMTLLPGIGHLLHEKIEHWVIAADGAASSISSPRGPVRARAAAGKKPRTLSPVELTADPGGNAPAFAAQPLVRAVNRTEFVDALRLCFERRVQEKSSFTLLALRIDASSPTPSPVSFPELADHVERVLKADDRLLVDLASRRLVLLMPEARQDLVQPFFNALQRSLAREHPASQQHLLESVSVVVVPDGLPFERAEDFMAYAMEAR